MKNKIIRIGLITMFIFMCVLSLLSGCTTAKSNVIEEATTTRITVKEYRNIQGYRFMIIEVDSIEYIVTNMEGSILKLKN